MTTVPSPRKHTVLIADDDARLLTALEKRLKVAGFNVIACQDAYMATDLARRHGPDVIVLDMHMPAGKGDSAHERLSKIPETSGIPVIYLTGDSSSQTRDRADQLGARALIAKPFDVSELLAHIESAVRSRAA